MVVVLILVFAFICLCLWNVVKTGAGSEGWLNDLFVDEEEMADVNEFEPESVLFNRGIDMGDLSTEHAEEIFDERFDDFYDKM